LNGKRRTAWRNASLNQLWRKKRTVTRRRKSERQPESRAGVALPWFWQGQAQAFFDSHILSEWMLQAGAENGSLKLDLVR
jgi:hypothetical protein